MPAVASVPKADTGITAGIIQTTQRIGGVLGATGATALAAAWTSHHPASAHLAAYTSGLRVAFAAAAVAAILGALIGLVLVDTKRAGAETEAEHSERVSTR
jgi:MFS family permease